MERPPFRLTVAALLGLIACIAVNLWLFRVGIFWGILGLNISKHVFVAYLCQICSIERRTGQAPSKIPPRVPKAPG